MFLYYVITGRKGIDKEFTLKTLVNGGVKGGLMKIPQEPNIYLVQL